jgi:hypothetical protein
VGKGKYNGYFKISKGNKKNARGRKAVGSLSSGNKKIIEPGITTLELDSFVEDYLKKHGARAEQKGYKGYRFAIMMKSVTVFRGKARLKMGISLLLIWLSI